MPESSSNWSAAPIPLPPLVDARRETAAALPIPLTSFIGREREVATVVERLRQQDVRLLTLTGPGGVGKTRLAVRAASDAIEFFPDGVWFVALASIRDPALVAATIAQALNVREAGSRTVEEGIREFLWDRRALLILDNFEHLLAAASLAAGLLAACPSLTMLVTSRAVLHVSGEHVIAVPPLGVPDPDLRPGTGELSATEAVRLFVARARAARDDFGLTEENGTTIAELCRRLNGLPLAIELAAARVNHLPLPALLRLLEPRLPLLTGGPRDQPARLQTMRDAIAWSYDLLSADEQTLFRLLAVFIGGFTLEAAEAIVGTTEGQNNAVLDGIASLVGKSLVQTIEGRGGEPRYQMLETIREFGLEQLAASGQEPLVRELHADFFRNLADQTGEAWLGPQYAAWMDRLDLERGNLRAALGWLVADERAELALQLTCALHHFWRARGPVDEALDWFARIEALSAPISERQRIDALVVASDLATVGGSTTLALGRIEEAVTRARKLGDPGLLGWALLTEGRARLLARDPGGAAISIREAFDLSRRHHPSPHEPVQLGILSQTSVVSDEAADGIARALRLSNLGVAVLMGGDAYGAIALLEEAQVLVEAQAFAYLQAANTISLADAVRETGDLARAEQLYHEGLRLSRAQHEQRNVAVALAGCAAVAVARAQASHAARMCGAASAVLERVGSSFTSGGHFSYEAAETMARAALGDTGYDAAWRQGHALTLDEAVEHACAWPLADPVVTTPLSPALLQEHGELSPRERDVLVLLSSGQTNQEIADALFLSRRTVSNHVASILAKLGVPTRAAAAAHAVRHGLC